MLEAGAYEPGPGQISTAALLQHGFQGLMFMGYDPTYRGECGWRLPENSRALAPPRGDMLRAVRGEPARTDPARGDRRGDTGRDRLAGREPDVFCWSACFSRLLASVGDERFWFADLAAGVLAGLLLSRPLGAVTAIGGCSGPERFADTLTSAFGLEFVGLLACPFGVLDWAALSGSAERELSLLWLLSLDD